MADRRSAKQANHGESRRQKRTPVGGVANWAAVNGDLLLHTLAVVAHTGGALRLGYTRDGGAYAIGIYGDGEPYTEYVRPSEDIDRYLAELAVDFGGDGDGETRDR